MDFISFQNCNIKTEKKPWVYKKLKDLSAIYLFTNLHFGDILYMICHFRMKNEKERNGRFFMNSDFEKNPSGEVLETAVPAEEEIRKPKRLICRLKDFNGFYLFAAFFIPFVIMLGVYACLGKHPFGNNSVLTLDLQAQYVYYYEAIRRLLTEGGSWLYSWERTLGGEFMGIVAYYMASPFNLILVLFPKKMLADAVMFIQLAKVGTMGLTFAYYLRKTRGTTDMQCVTFSVLYALSAYSVVQLMNPMWLDAMVFLPLLVLGIESMIRQKKFILYTVSLTTVFCTNYYMGYMCAIFTFIYFLYYYFLVRDEVPQNKGAEKGNRFFRILRSRGFETFMRFGVFTVVALCISAFMLLSAWYSLQFGKMDFGNTDFTPSLRFDFLDIFVKLLPGSYDTVRPNGLPMIYCGMLAVIALPLFYMSPVISRKKKLLSSMVLAVFLCSFCVNTIDLVWHGFSTPNWLNYRYSYIVSFFLLLMAVDGLRGLRKIPLGKILTVGAFLGVLILIVQKLEYVFLRNTKEVPLDDVKCILLSLILLAAYVIVLYYMKQDKMETVGTFALAVIVCVEMFATALITVADVQSDVGSVKYGNYVSGNTEKYDGYTGAIARLEPVVEAIKEKDRSFYRMESTVYRRQGGVNEPMALGFNGISHSTSTLNSAVITLLNKLGYSSTAHWTKYLGGTPVADALLGIKYVIVSDDDSTATKGAYHTLDKNFFVEAASAPEYYEYVPSENTIYAMQNTKALSVAYGVSPELIARTTDFLNPPYYTALELQNDLIDAMLSGVTTGNDVFKSIYAPFDVDDGSYRTYTHHHEYTDENGETQKAENKYYIVEPDDGNSAILRFTMTAADDGNIYAHFPGVLFQGMSTTCKIYVNNVYVCDYFTNETWTVQNLGTFEKGEEVEVELRFSGGDLYISRASSRFFYYVDYAALNEAFSALEEASMYVEEHGNDYLRGVIDIPEGQELIFTSIPYDEGWKVYIDGKKTETVKVLDSLLAVPTTAGFHEIEFVYRPISATLGIPLTVIGILALALLILWSRVRKVRIFEKAEKTTHFFYCKGDETAGWTQELLETALAMKDDAPTKTPEENAASLAAETLSDEKTSDDEAIEEKPADEEIKDQ